MTDGIAIEVRVARSGSQIQIETFRHTVPDETSKSLIDAVDYFEGQVGTVLTIHTLSGRRLYKSMVEAWDI
jgi:hypothetical protein